jgi:hypothetical protein
VEEIMRKPFLAFVLLCFLSPTISFGQSSNATVSGTVADSSGAVLPGVSVTATNNATAVVNTIVTNESGAYNFVSLLPGSYKVTAELPGFRTKSYTDVQLGNADRIRLNFALDVATQAQSVEVTVAADTLLAASTQSVGEILGQNRIAELPTIANDVMDFYRVVPGVFMEDNGVRGSFAGLGGFGTTNITRDGVDASGGARWTANALTATHMNPDLIGEVKVVVAPVDAEMGRGNAQLQFLTRSGTNQFRGSAVWNVRNSALDANTWNNNRQVDARTGAWSPTAPDWHNVHNFVGSYGGPIVKNKTFFFVLWDQSLVNLRTIQNPIVLTPCARNGIFRYFDGWNNGNATQVTQGSGSTPITAVVDGVGRPVTPASSPTGGAFTGQLRYASVFGPLASNPTRADCSDAVVQGNPWDSNRRTIDPTGFVTKFLNAMPPANNYEVGDGLNTAGHRWVRNERDGQETIFALDDTGLNRPNQLARKQINGKLDHNFNQQHKLSGSYTYEYSKGANAYETWPTGYRGSRFRRPQLLSSNFVSTLSPKIVNEFRTGFRRTGGNSYPGILDPENGAAVQSFFPNYNGYPVYVGLGSSATGSQINYQGNQISGGGTSQYNDVTQQWTFADSLSWTKGVHTIKFGGEIRRSFSRGFDAGVGNTALPRAIGGDAPNAAISTNAISGTNMPGLVGSTTTGNNQRMRQLLSFLAGSLSQVTQFYYMQDPNKLDRFEDFKSFPQRLRETHRNEFSAFVKDDWKVTRNLTLNVGLRWDWYGSIYDQAGMMPLPTEGPAAIFGISGRTFEEAWSKPGPARAALTAFEYVGKNSPKPGKSYFPNDWNNFGPAVGFAWQVPWFGAGKTTVRGGYQITYNGLPSFNSLTQTQVAPGSTLAANYQGDSGSNAYLDLTKVPALIPVPTIVKPMEAVPVTDGTQSVYIPQPNLVNPYVQNLTLSITRSLGSNMALDLRAVSTLGRKQWNVQFQTNNPNFLTNGLKEAFDAVRSGGESELLNNMFKGINIAGTGYGPVGGVTGDVQQTAALHLRNDTRFRSNLANGNYQALATTLASLNYVTTAPGNSGLPPISPGVNGEVLRFNGFPSNFIRTNPQFQNTYMITNLNTNNYHSLEATFTLRPTHGINFQSTYTWSKNLGLFGEVGRNYQNPFDRADEYSILPDTRRHDLRTNGTFTLPFGPNRLFFSSTTGVLARVLENWSASWIVNLTSGTPITFSGQSGLYTYQTAIPGTADLVGPFDPKGSVKFTGSGSAAGSYFDPAKVKTVQDPQCGGVTPLNTLRDACTLNAIADVATGQILLQNAAPGRRGNLSLFTAEGPGRWRFDTSLMKKIRVDETKSLQFRLDATNVFNHPEPNTGNLVTNINTANFGLFTTSATGSPKTDLRRQFQAQLRFEF